MQVPAGSGYLDVSVLHTAIDGSGNFYRTSDLINMCRYLQKIASQNDYDALGILPVQFMDLDEEMTYFSVGYPTIDIPLLNSSGLMPLVSLQGDPTAADRLRADTLEMAQRIPSPEVIERANAYNALVKIDTGPEVPQLPPDWETTTLFFYDPAVSLLKDGLYANVKSDLSAESKGYVLSRFTHYGANGEFVISDITVGELLNGTDMLYRGYGMSNSGYLEVMIDPLSAYSEKDLLNIYNLIQNVAFTNGYAAAVPVIFLKAPKYQFPPSQSAPPSSVTNVDENIWERVLRGWDLSHKSFRLLQP